MDHYVVHVGSSIGAIVLEDDVHQLLESSWCTVETTGQDPILPMAVVCEKGGLGIGIGSGGPYTLTPGYKGHLPLANSQ